MYKPIRDGIPKKTEFVSYTEIQPDPDLSNVVDCFWELKTEKLLSQDCIMHAIPDACVNILLNQKDTSIAGITELQTTFEVLNLGKDFHYVGIQLRPGAWKGDSAGVSNKYIDSPYRGDLPLQKINNDILHRDFENQIPSLVNLVNTLMSQCIISPNHIIQKIIENLNVINTVSDMASITELSPRQLQRNLKKDVRFSPHDFLKVLRLQQTFNKSYLISYTDQSHFIHAFKKITGHTPTEYLHKFDV